MVHSTYAQGHVMGGRDTSPLGIPKSPSFHSGLDLVASASVDSLKAAQASLEQQETTGFPCKISFYNVMAVNSKAGGAVGEMTGRNGVGGVSHLAMPPAQKNSTAVRTMQSMGQLPLLKGELSCFFFV